MPVLSLSIGSNIEPAKNIRLAVAALREIFDDLTCSRVYESEAVGFDGDNFLNLVAVTETNLGLGKVAKLLKQLEDILGRDRQKPKFSGRIIDIDILTYGSSDGKKHDMELPRAEITHNAFVLLPLSELLPDLRDPASGCSYRQLWEKFDKSSQRLWPIAFDWQD